jgi:hypothetical protein
MVIIALPMFGNTTTLETRAVQEVEMEQVESISFAPLTFHAHLALGCAIHVRAGERYFGQKYSFSFGDHNGYANTTCGDPH